MSELIDKQAALDALRSRQTYLFDSKDPDKKIELRSAEMAIEELPTVQPDHVADIGKKVSISCGRENDLISRQAAIDALARMMPRSYTPDGSHPADEEIFQVQEVFVDCIEALEILPSVQPEIIRCKDCKYMIDTGDTGDDLMCNNAKGWVVATASDFGCVLAERRTDG